MAIKHSRAMFFLGLMGSNFRVTVQGFSVQIFCIQGVGCLRFLGCQGSGLVFGLCLHAETQSHLPSSSATWR